MFLNITPNITNWSSDSKEFSLIFDENPLTDFVELPDDALEGGLWYSNIYCGVLRGALEMVKISSNEGQGNGTERSSCLGTNASGSTIRE